jgi:membrane fusion protein, multidrug efflux system
MKKKWLVGGVAVLVLAAAGGGAVFLKGGALPFGGGAQAKTGAMGKDGKDGKPEVPLEFIAREVVQPAMLRLPSVVEFSGPLVAPGTAIVRAKAAGTLLAMTAAEGSRVSAGQSLGRIDLSELSSRVAERNAQLESARTALAQAERTYASSEGLAAQKFISPIALENQRAAVDTARSQLGAAQAALDTTRVSLRDASLVTPIAGIVAKRHVVVGEKLAPEQQVMTIVDLSRLELAGSVGTHEVARLAPGMAVQVQVEGVAQPVAGRIARIAPAAEPGTRSIGVTIELDNPKEQLRAGQYALARVVLADDTERLTVPATAVGNTSGQDHVWVIEGGVLARRAITLGRRDEREGRIEVLNGLQPGSQVLSARFDNLREGAKALVVAARASPVASAAASTPVVR